MGSGISSGSDVQNYTALLTEKQQQQSFSLHFLSDNNKTSHKNGSQCMSNHLTSSSSFQRYLIIRVCKYISVSLFVVCHWQEQGFNARLSSVREIHTHIQDNGRRNKRVREKSFHKKKNSKIKKKQTMKTAHPQFILEKQQEYRYGGQKLSKSKINN